MLNMLPMGVTIMTICVCVLGAILNLLMRKLKQNGNRCGTAKTRNAGYVSMMRDISVRGVLAGFVLAVVVVFVGQSFVLVQRAFGYGKTCVECRIWCVVLFVDMFGKTGIT